MNSHPTTTAVETGSWIVADEPVATALTGLIGREDLRAAETTAGLGPSLRRLCLVPSMPEPRTFADSCVSQLDEAIAAPLTALMSALREAVRQMAGNTDEGRIVVLLPQAPSMGTDGFTTAAVCGGAISMLRTLALELRRQDISVNTLFYEGDLSPDSPTTAAVADLIGTLLFDRTAPVTGQEIFVTAGADLGRLHP
jgi:NAD(P)-dependent dehydrogenase (short-subunit alcohol dehydrogenase family)